MAAVVPIAAGITLVLAFMLAEVAGSSVFTYESPQNLAEAAAMANAAGVLRYLRAGANPADVVTVRPDVISSTVTRVNALEAAIWGREVAIVRLLVREGALGRREARQDLACLSEALHADAITEFLAPEGTSGCDPDQTLRRIQDRSR